MNMYLAEFLLVFTVLWKLTLGLRCYKCEAMSETYDEPLCEHFDYSATFIKECDSSSMCYKRITTSQFGTKIYERGCAKQTMSGYQEHLNGRWEKVNKINEVYDEGCVDSPGDEERVTRTEHCFCRGALCNHAGLATGNVLAMRLDTVVSKVVISVFAIGVSMFGMLVLR